MTLDIMSNRGTLSFTISCSSYEFRKGVLNSLSTKHEFIQLNYYRILNNEVALLLINKAKETNDGHVQSYSLLLFKFIEKIQTKSYVC